MKDNIPTRIAYGKALEEFGSDTQIYVFDADLASCTHNEFFAKKYPNRFFNIGIAEANMVNIAAGFASTGKTAVCASFAIFSSGRAYEQIRNSVAYPKLNVKIVGSHAGLTVGEDGATHQCIEDISLMRTIPNMVLLSPCDANETREAVHAMLQYEGPCYIRTSRLAAPQYTQDIKNYEFLLGKACELQEGGDLTICATGYPVYAALQAAKRLADRGISTRVLDFHTIKPIDKEAIIKAAKETKRIITVEEHSVIGGLGSAISEVTGENYPVRICRIGVQDTFGHSGGPLELLDKHGLSEDKIFERALNFINN